MKYLKLFEEFSHKIYEYTSSYNPNSNIRNPLSVKRSEGRVNWFTREEIIEIRDTAKSIGIPFIFESSKKGYDNYFGDERGRGLNDSIREFYTQGGDLCGEVNLKSKSGRYKIVKSKGQFILNGKSMGNNISDALSIIR
jgi:hypothetical protein